MEAGSPSKVQQAGGALEASGAAAAAAAAAAAGAQQTSIGAVAGADAAVAAAAAAGGSGGGASAATTGSAALDEPPRVTPPVAFGIVEPGVYRSNVPVEANLDYLQGLGLRTALYLSPELPTRTLRGFLAANQIELHHLGLETWRPSDDGSNPISVELMKESLELLLDGTRHPLLVLCSSGLHHTGVLVGCLRRLQQWNLTSILQEYRSFAGSSKSRQSDAQFIEMFDLDLVSLPQEPPAWYLAQQESISDDMVEMRRLDDAGALQGPSNVLAGESVAYRRFLFSAQAPTLTTNEYYAKNKMT